MLRSLTAGVAALSLTFSTISPAYADGLDREDVGKLLFGLVAIAALSQAIENNRDDDAPSIQTHGSRNDWSELSRNHPRRVLPANCIRTVETRFGDQRIYGQQCLERNYSHIDNLPARCAVRVYSNNGPRRGFDPLCLREQGYRSDRRN